MSEYRTRLGEDGRVVIPASCRRQLHLKAGEELVIRMDDEELHVYSLKHSLKKAQELVRKYNKKNKSLLTILKTMRQKDAQDE